MKVLAWVFIGAIGAVWTYVTLTTADDELAIISGLIGMLSWLLFAFFALDVTTIDQSGTVHTMRYPAMAAYGLAMAAPNLYVALTGPLNLIRDRKQLAEEVS